MNRYSCFFNTHHELVFCILQDSWNESLMNDHFESILVNRECNKLDDDELCALVLSASYKAIDDFQFTCQECEIELRTRNPRVTAHCRYLLLFFIQIQVL